MQAYIAILPIIGAILCILLGLFTVSRNPRHYQNIGFALGLASLSVNEIGNAITMMGYISAGLHVSSAGIALMPICWMIFSIVFARAGGNETIKVWAPTLGIMALTSAFFVYSAFTGTIFIFQPGTEVIGEGYMFDPDFSIPVGPAGIYLHVYVIIGIVLNLVNLESTLRSSSGMLRWQIKYIIFGVGTVLMFFIYLSSQVLLFSSVNFQSIPATSSVLIMCVGMMAFFIVRHRLLDVDIFVSRYVIYRSFTVFVVGLYLIIVGAVAHAISYFALPVSYFVVTFFVFASILTLMIFLFSSTLRRKVQLFISRHFYKHKYEFRDKWMETTEKLASRRNINELGDTLIELIKETLGASSISLWLFDEFARGFSRFASNGRTSVDKIEGQSSFIRCIKKEQGPFYFNAEWRRHNCDDSCVLPIVDSDAVLCVPLLNSSELIGFMMLGEDISGEPYMIDDFQILTAVTTQAAAKIKTIKLTQELMAARELETFHTMSSFVMHDLKNLTNSLSLISQNARYIDRPEFQLDAINTINSTVTRMKALIERLSAIPSAVELKREKTDIDDIIKNVIERTMSNSSKDITIRNTSSLMPILSLDPHAMEMVFINLLNNACDAIEGEGEITVSSLSNEDSLTITITDNGSGMSAEFIENSLFKPFKSTKKGGFGIGLYQCKAIIEGHQGLLRIDSREGEGTSVTITLPVS